MLRIRHFETALSAHKDHGFQLLSTGEEAVAVGLCGALRPQDQLLTSGRSIAPALARGLEPGRLMAELLGKADGYNRGRAGRGHLSAPELGFFGAHAVVAGNLSVATGVALARTHTKAPGIVCVVFGDGAAGAGGLHEAFNIAALWRLPILFVCNNNQLSVSASSRDTVAAHPISTLGNAYGMPSETIDGSDVVTVLDAATRLVARVEAEHRPAFLECVSYRLGRHSTSARETRSKDELRELMRHCPIDRLSERLVSTGALNLDALSRLIDLAHEEAAAAMTFALHSPYPDAEEALHDVY